MRYHYLGMSAMNHFLTIISSAFKRIWSFVFATTDTNSSSPEGI